MIDVYQVWLDIPVGERPVDHYRLLGLRQFETDTATIANAADRVQAHVEQFRSGVHADACGRLFSEIQQARECLLDPVKRQAYDATLSRPAQETQVAPPPPVPGGGQTQPSNSAERPTIAAAPPVPGTAPAPTSPTSPAPGQAPLATPGPGAAPASSGSQIDGPIPQSPHPGSGSVASAGPAPAHPAPVAQPVWQAVPAANPLAAQPPFTPQAGLPAAGIPTASPAPPGGIVPGTAQPTAYPQANAMPGQVPPNPPPPVSATKPTDEPASWVPPNRTGRIGKSVAAAVAGEATGPVQTVSTVKTVQRRVHQERTMRAYNLAVIVLVIGGILVGAVLMMAMYYL